LDVGWLNANMQRKAGSLSARPLAAQRPTVASLFEQ